MKCDCCGKFRKLRDLVRMMGEYDEEWNECRFCVSKSDLDQYFKGVRYE